MTESEEIDEEINEDHPAAPYMHFATGLAMVTDAEIVAICVLGGASTYSGVVAAGVSPDNARAFAEVLRRTADHYERLVPKGTWKDLP
jgi:hypothetical protein